MGAKGCLCPGSGFDGVGILGVPRRFEFGRIVGLAGPQHFVGDLFVAVFAQLERSAEQGLEYNNKGQTTVSRRSG